MTLTQSKKSLVTCQVFSSSLMVLFTWKWASRYRLLFVFGCKIKANDFVIMAFRLTRVVSAL